MELRLRLAVQLAKDPLFPLEQLAIGGRFSVRGYRENQLARDNGILVSLESRISLIRHQRWADRIQIVPFIDFGWGSNRKVETPDTKVLASIGLGVRWAAKWKAVVPMHSRFEVFWGYRLNDVETSGGNLQDKALHLQFALATP